MKRRRRRRRQRGFTFHRLSSGRRLELAASSVCALWPDNKQAHRATFASVADGRGASRELARRRGERIRGSILPRRVQYGSDTLRLE